MSPATAVSTDTAIAVLDDPAEYNGCTRWVVGARGQRMAETVLQLSGMHCAACSGLIEQALQRVDGVSAAAVNAASERATVCWDPERTQPSTLIAAVQSAGYGAVPDAAAPARALRRQAHRQALWRLFVAAFCAMQVMMLATPSYVAGPGELEPDMRMLLNWGSWMLTLPVLAFSAGPFFSGAWQALRARRIGMDVPVSLGVAITFIASTGATFSPDGVFGHDVYFDSLTMFVSFLLGARFLELSARHRAAEALESSLARLPETAWRIQADGSAEGVSLHRLQPGDLLRVPLGQAFPADGLVEQGHTRADEALLTGESVAVDKPPGAAVVAGSTNLGAPVLMRVQRVGGDTRLEAIVSMMRSAMAQRPASAALADRWASPFLWAVLVLAAGAAAAWSVIDPSRAVWVAVSVLIVTCPCALSLAAPATLVAAARGLARRGVLVQRLDALERLAQVQQVFLDKTGTLTEDRLQQSALHLTDAGLALLDGVAVAPAQAGAQARAQVRAQAIAAALAAWSSHPLSRAIVDAHAALPGAPTLSQTLAGWSEVQEAAGQGVEAVDREGRRWRLGGPAWTGAQAAQAAQADAQVFLSRDGQVLAALDFEESLRPGTEAALRELQDAGVQLTLLTGDAPARAQALARRLGVPDVHARATPEDKLAAVAQAQRQGRCVAMVGDGINDAPVLARADVSLAMGQGALVSRSQADAVITSNRLGDLVRARRTAQHAVRIVRQNFIWAGSYNAVSIPMALAGYLPPWAAGLGMALSSLVVITNALRAAR